MIKDGKTYFESPTLGLGKLVRDKYNVTDKLPANEHVQALVAKLKEEFEELLAAKNEREIREEAGDLIDVLEYYLVKNGVRLHEVHEQRFQKVREKGSFTMFRFLKVTK